MLQTKNIFPRFEPFRKGVTTGLSVAEKVLFIALTLLKTEGSISSKWEEAPLHLKNQVLTDVLDGMSYGLLDNKPATVLGLVFMSLRDHGVIPSTGRVKWPHKKPLHINARKKIQLLLDE